MAERKTHTSTEVKKRYNKKTYDVIAVSVPKELAAQFKEKCRLIGVSQAGIIKKAISEFVEK